MRRYEQRLDDLERKRDTVRNGMRRVLLMAGGVAFSFILVALLKIWLVTYVK